MAAEQPTRVRIPALSQRRNSCVPEFLSRFLRSYVPRLLVSSFPCFTSHLLKRGNDSCSQLFLVGQSWPHCWLRRQATSRTRRRRCQHAMPSHPMSRCRPSYPPPSPQPILRYLLPFATTKAILIHQRQAGATSARASLAPWPAHDHGVKPNSHHVPSARNDPHLASRETLKCVLQTSRSGFAFAFWRSFAKPKPKREVDARKNSPTATIWK